MIPFEKALEITLNSAITSGTERVGIFAACQRILAEDLHSDVSMPPFNKSAMDGYACRKSDIMNGLEVIEEIAAGALPVKTVGKNQCSRIMTGAMVPKGADCVIMKEDIEEIAPGRVKCMNENSKTNICYEGEDVTKGDLVLKKGIQLSPASVAILAAIGCTNPLVYKLPRIAILSTGDELVEPDQIPGLSKIRNSNGYQLAAQVLQMGILCDYLGIVADNEVSVKTVLTRTLRLYDVTIISGGVSVGDFDFVPTVLKQLEVNIRVHGMEVRPGKHLLFGERANHFVFGMPGNPVSSFVQFEVLVKPFLHALTGKTSVSDMLYLSVDEDYVRKKGDQLIFVPVTLTNQGKVLPLDYHGSAHIQAYTMAQGIMEVPKGVSIIKKGEIVCVRPL